MKVQNLVLFVLFLFIVFGLYVSADANFVSVSERTAQVRDAIVNAVPGVDAADDVTAAHLATITRLNLRAKGISKLKPRDFSGLTALINLNLYNNELIRLPDQTFEGLTSLKTLRLGRNAIDPLPLVISLKQVNEGTFQVVMPTGAPFDIVLPINVTNGSISSGATMITLSKGTTKSDAFTVVPLTDTSPPPIVQIGALPRRLPVNHYGYIFARSTACTRTLQVQEAITAAVPGITDCRDVTDAHLTAIQTLDLRNRGISTLRAADFLGLPALKNLYLSGNQLTSLPTGVFSGLSNLESLHLHQNQLSNLPADIFSGLSSLTYLYLYSNQLAELHADVFSELPSLAYLLLNNNKLTSLSPNVFRGLSTPTLLFMHGNTADPLPLTVRLEKVGENRFKVTVPAGAPFDITLSLSVTNGNITGSTENITIAAGNVESDPFTVTRTPGTSDSVTVDIKTLSSLPTFHLGYEVVTSEDLPLEVINSINKAPVFTEGSNTTRTIAENTEAGVNIGSAVSATDADEDTLTYSLGGTDAAAFAIDTGSGQLRTEEPLDYETKNAYSVTVTVSDGNLTDTINVTIKVTDEDEVPVEDEVPTTEVTDEDKVPATDDPVPPKGPTPGNSAPVFVDGTSTTRSVPENTGAGVNIGSTVSATDADGDTLIYSLGGTDATSFSIDSTTGQLRTRTALDYETKNAYSVTVSVSDGTLTGTINVTIKVTDKDEVPTTDDPVSPKGPTPGNSAPVFVEGTSTTRSVPENTGTGVNIEDVVSATDADGDTLTYFLSGTDAKVFSIDTTTGQLRTNAALDYETKSSYSVIVTVSDGNLTSAITVIINVSDIDEPSQTDEDPPQTDEDPPQTDEDPPQTDEDPPQTNLSEDVWMPDVHLRFAVRTALDIGSAALTQTKMLELTSLTTQHALISNLKGLEHAKNLTHLDVASNQITSISVLQGLTKLVHINIEDNQVTDISVLTNLTELQYIYVAGNPITDLSPMSNRPLLGASWPVVKSENSPEVKIYDANLAAAIRKALSLEDDASITEADMEQLISLTATNAQIDSLSGLQYAKNLTALDLSNNEIWSLSGITGLRKLTHLNLSNNKIDFVYGLHWIVSLKELKLAGNPIDIKDAASLLILKNLSVVIDIKLPTLVNVPDRALAKILRSTLSIPIRIPITKEVLQTMTSLENSYIPEGYRQGAEEIEDLTGLEHATAMTTLSLPYHDVSNITALQNLTQLTSLDLRNNYEISDYTPLSGLTNLTSLNLVNTYISDITFLSSLTKLTELNIGVDFYGTLFGESELSDISSLANLTELTSLKLGETKVSDISDLSDLTKLTTLSLRKTKVRSISTLSNLTKLEILLLYGNKIVDISPLTGLTNLSYLTLSGNPVVNTLPLCPLLRANGGNLVYVDIEVTNCPPPPNNAPEFTEGSSATRSVAENTASGIHIGTVVSATDADTDDTLTYSLGGTDAATFGIDATNGQLKTKAPLDYETKSTYTVTVSVSDGNDGSDSIDVTINVTDVNETESHVSTNITTCSVSHKDGNVYDVTIEGTVTGIQSVKSLTVHGYVFGNPNPIGSDRVGFLDAGETKNFSITGTLTDDGSTNHKCHVILTYQVLGAPLAQSLPVKTALLTNYPNPFNPETWIPYQLSKPSDVSITIYDIRGRVVRTLILGHQAAGVYQSRSRAAHWDGRNHFGEKVATGVYFYRLTAGNFSATRKMLIMK